MNFVGVNFQSINRRSSDFNKFEITLTDASLQKNECSETSTVKWQSYTPSNGQQEGQAQSIQLTQLCQAEHLVN